VKKLSTRVPEYWKDGGTKGWRDGGIEGRIEKEFKRSSVQAFTLTYLIFAWHLALFVAEPTFPVLCIDFDFLFSFFSGNHAR